MIYHDRVTIEVGETDWEGNPSWTTHSVAPCSLSPINSLEANVEGPIATRYTLVTPVNLKAIKADPAHEDIRLLYNGEALEFEAGIEVHKLLGRFHHCEAIVKDFGV